MNKEAFKLNSIRTKLVISLIAICIIPLIILGVGSYNKSKTILSDKLTVTSSQTLKEVNNGLVDYFKGFSKIVTMTAGNPVIMNIDTENNTEVLNDILKSVKETDKDILDIYYGTESGKFAIYPATEMPEGYDATQRPWYKQAMENRGKIIITPPYVDVVTGNNVIGIAQTVEKDGQVVGVIGIDLTLATLGERITDKKVGNSGYVFISDLAGTVLAHPKKDVVNTDAAAKLSIWSQVQAEQNGFIDYEFQGVNKSAVYETNEVTGWKVVATLDESEVTVDTKTILYSMFTNIGVMAIISIIVSIYISKGIANNIKILREVFAKASSGDLTVTYKALTKDEFDELATSFNTMISNISQLMKSVTNSSNTVLETSTSLASMSEEISASINEVAKAIEDVSSGANEQVQSAQKGSDQMEDLSKKLDRVSVNSNEMNRISSDTKGLGVKGLNMIETLTEKSNKTKSATNQVNSIVQDMNESTKQISSISETIANITEQTNLLSLNASIESARAGEAGKGFAVVAEEIRKLAEESKASTEEIKKIISNIQSKSDTAVKAIELTEAVVNEQETAVGQTQEIFNEILKSIESMITKVDEVKSSVGDINKSKQSTINEIESITFISEQTASASEEVTASAEEITATMEELSSHANQLQMLAQKLGQEISQFKTK